MASKRSIRRSATVSPFGVGAIYDFGDESLVAMDIFHWQGRGEKIQLPRLEKELGVNHFLMAPVVRNRYALDPRKVPYHRFPQWLFCPSCRRMIKWGPQLETSGEHPRCTTCPGNSKLVPMRFVAACKGGHLIDVPWRGWAHSNAINPAQKQCQNRNLKFENTKAGGGGLGSLWVVCETCEAKRSLQGIARMDSLRAVINSCENSQPWERGAQIVNRTPCQHFPQVLQRGATNLYFPKVQSALDIPDLTGPTAILLDDNIKSDIFYNILIDHYVSTTTPYTNPSVTLLAGMIASRLKCTPADVLSVIRADLEPTQAAQPKGADGLLREEWNAFISATAPNDDDPKARFIAEPAEMATFLNSVPSAHPFRTLSKCLDRVVLARRLREVRALQGFERQEPGTEMVKPGLHRDFDWLPGIEVYGEGIFLSLDEKRLAQWEDSINIRLDNMKARHAQTNLAFLPKFSPRFVLLHTLAHMLIRQLSFECGYASSSLRERIFAAVPEGGVDGMAGILIYTADGDSEGSLGGLVREGQPERLFPTLLTSLQNARWCSADPICRELEAQGLQGLNRAACHACALVSETSCLCSNVMLDRAVLVGDDSGMPGYFNAVCQAAEGVHNKG